MRYKFMKHSFYVECAASWWVFIFFLIICFLTFFFSNGEQKLLGILIAVGEAVACVLLGMYGNVSQLGAGNAILIIIQLCFVGIIVICLKTVEPQ